jgi:hypothetical protein
MKEQANAEWKKFGLAREVEQVEAAQELFSAMMSAPARVRLVEELVGQKESGQKGSREFFYLAWMWGAIFVLAAIEAKLLVKDTTHFGPGG